MFKTFYVGGARDCYVIFARSANPDDTRVIRVGRVYAKYRPAQDVANALNAAITYVASRPSTEE